MRIALFHNYYATPGGEDVVFELERDTLQSLGHQVFPYTVSNGEAFGKATPFSKARYAWDATDSQRNYDAIKAFLEKHSPDIGHIHNWFPLLTPAIYRAHNDLGIPVVQTIHNYRLSCAKGTHWREQQPCHKCRPGHTWPALRYQCYRGSLLGTAVWSRTFSKHWASGTFTKQVHHYICPSQQLANYCIQQGLPEDRITVVPNASSGPTLGTYPRSKSINEVLIVSRLSSEKGVDIALEAWKQLRKTRPSNLKLTIVGDGPDKLKLMEQASGLGNIQFLGQLSKTVVWECLRHARFLVAPSLWPEPFGLSIIEALASGVPVIVPDTGAPLEIVKDGVQGVLFRSGDVFHLAEQMQHLIDRPDLVDKMSMAARIHYEEYYTPLAHVNRLLELFGNLSRKKRG